MLKILIISQYFWPENFRINDVATLLAANQCQVTVLTGLPNYPEGAIFDGYKSTIPRKEIHKNGVLIFRVPIIPRSTAGSFRLFINYLSYIISSIFFGTFLLRNKNFDLIFVYAPSPIFQSVIGIYFKFILRKPLVTWVQDLWPECVEMTGHIKNKAILNAVDRLVSAIYKGNDLLLVQSKGFINSVSSRSGKVPVQYFPNPGPILSRDLKVKPGSNATEKFFLKNGFNLVFAGNLGKVQSLNTLLGSAELLVKHEDIRLIIVGSGSESGWLQKQILNRGLVNVVATGRYSESEMVLIFKSASALVASLIRSPILSLTVPAKLQSYLAAGKPILCSMDGEGRQLILESGAGICCAPEDSDSLAAAIVKMSKMSKEDLDAMGKAGREYYEINFEPTNLVLNLIARLRLMINLHAR